MIFLKKIIKLKQTLQFSQITMNASMFTEPVMETDVIRRSMLSN